MKAQQKNEAELSIKLEGLNLKVIGLLNQFPIDILSKLLSEQRRELLKRLNSNAPERSEGITHYISLIEGVISAKELKKLRAV